MQKVHRHPYMSRWGCELRGFDCLSVFWFRSFHSLFIRFFSPFLHSTCSLSISKA